MLPSEKKQPVHSNTSVYIYPSKDNKRTIVLNFILVSLAESVVILFLVGTFLIMNFFNIIPLSQTHPVLFGWLPHQRSTSPHESPTRIQVPFEYTVTALSESEIIVSGEKGDLTLPRNSAVTIYQGDRGSNKRTDFSALQSGQKVNVDLIPGKSASVYIIQ